MKFRLFNFKILLLWLGNLLFFQNTGIAGDVFGKIFFPAETRQQTRISRYGGGESQTMSPTSSRADIKAVVYIDDIFPDSSFQLPGQNPILDQRNEQFIPYMLPVLQGATVDFPNNDRIYHNVFSFSPAKTFDLGKYPTKAQKSVTFDKTGIVSVFCEIHAHMNAFILVLPNPYFTTVKSDGGFEIPGIPAGDYTLKAFLGRNLELEQQISVPDSGTVSVNFEM